MSQANRDPFGVKRKLVLGDSEVVYYSLPELAKQPGFEHVARLPVTIKVLLEAALRQFDDFTITQKDIEAIASWRSDMASSVDVPFKPARVVLQDFTGVPAVVDLAAMRDAMADDLGGDPTVINPVLDVDLVIDHSLQVDYYATHDALAKNAAYEFERNRERYEFLRWGADTFANFRVVPPATGIVHQVNLEHLASGVKTKVVEGEVVAFPDSLVGTDSHTTMINGIGVLGWGVGGIEAEAVMLGQPIYMVLPEVVGFRLIGELPQGATATDLVLRITEMLRAHGVVGKFVEFFGKGLSKLSVPDRATIANMAPEYGATCGFFPVDDATLEYLRLTNRSAETIALVEAYNKAQGMYRTDATPESEYSAVLELDMSTVVPSIAGPKRPQDRIALSDAKPAFAKALAAIGGPEASSSTAIAVDLDGETYHLSHGSVVIAAITSCTNTSNPSVMLGAGLLAKKAVDLGLSVKRYVKTSLAPGSRVVTRYLEAAGLVPYLEALGFHLVGYGCTTCIGNSGPLRPEITKVIQDHKLVVASVLSGNRNFEGRIHPEVRANYLASPPLVVAYALAGTMDVDFATEPVGYDRGGTPVYLKDIWPSQDEIRDLVARSLDREMFASEYANVFTGNETWNAIDVPKGERYAWNPKSTYIAKPTFFVGIRPQVPSLKAIEGARVLALLGDSVTTDHISPAGAIKKDSPAGRWLMEHGVEPKDFNTYGSRRGNHEVMMRGTFANIRIRNQLVPGVEGGMTKHLPSGEIMSIWDAAVKYMEAGIPLIVLAGKEYGTGSSRDWAAKGVYLQGVKAVIAESYERIHRSNLVGMGVLPLQFMDGQSVATLGLDGTETYTIAGLSDALQPGQMMTVKAVRADGSVVQFDTLARVDTPVEVSYLRNGGILHTVLRQMAAGQSAAKA